MSIIFIIFWLKLKYLLKKYKQIKNNGVNLLELKPSDRDK